MRLKELKQRRGEIQAAIWAEGSKEGPTTLAGILYGVIGLTTSQAAHIDRVLMGGNGTPKQASIDAVVEYGGVPEKAWVRNHPAVVKASERCDRTIKGVATAIQGGTPERQTETIEAHNAAIEGLREAVRQARKDGYK